MQPTPLNCIPIPHFEWIAQLDDGEVKRARLFDKQGSLLLHISRHTNTSQVYEFPLYNSSNEQDFTPISLYHITQDSTGRPQRLSSERLRATVQEHEDEIRAFLHKAQWVFKALQGGHLPTGCKPPENALFYERALRDYRSIVECQSESTPPHTETLPSSLHNETPLLRKLYNHEWAQLFQDAAGLQAGRNNELSYLEKCLLRGLSGNIPALRDQLNGPLEIPGRCPSNFFLGAVLQKLELHQHAVACYKNGLPTHLSAKHSYLTYDLGKCYVQLGNHEEASKWFLQTVLLNKRDHGATLRIVEKLKTIEKFEEAESVLAGSRQENTDIAELSFALAELHLWKGEYQQARLIYDQLPPASFDDARARKIRGILELITGDPEKAKSIFSQLVINNPSDSESCLWLAEIYLREKRYTDAEPLLVRARQKEQTGVHVTLDYSYRIQSSRANNDQKQCSEFASLLKSLGYTPPVDLADKTHPELDELVLATLSRFKGNRSSLLTVVETKETTTQRTRLKHLRLDSPDCIMGSRAACSDALRKLRNHSPNQVRENFNHLINLYDTSPHPYFYRGELYLWLGEWDKAYSDFDKGTTRQTTRWSFVGKAAVHIMRQEYPEALKQVELLRKNFAPLAAATTNVYLGEMFLLLGEYSKAEKFLTDAISAKPGRVASRMNLAMVYQHQGRQKKALALFNDLITHYPGLFWDAIQGYPQQWPPQYEEMIPLFERALGMMRGNRSSHLITYFDHTHQLRVLQDAIAWNDFAKKNSYHIGDALAHRLNEHALRSATLPQSKPFLSAL